MASERRVSIRLAAVDGDRVKAELMNIGREGKAALESIGNGANPATAGLNRVTASAGTSLKQMEALAQRAGRAAIALRAAGATTGTVAERIDVLTGAAPRMRRSLADMEAYGAELDRLRARHNPLFAVINEYRNKLADIRQAHAVGAISADEMTDAISRERQAALASIGALKGRTTAIAAMGKVSNAAHFQMRNLQFQMMDIAQGIPLLFQAPAAGLLNFANQGAQISQIYGPEEGGVTRAVREAGSMVGRFALRLAPVAVVAGLVAAAIGGMTHEINEVSDVTVGFGDTALAVWQVISGGIYDFIKPAVDAIAPWFSAAWDVVVDVTKTAGNLIINANRISVAGIKYAWDALPLAIGAAITAQANLTISGVEFMVNRAIDLLNLLSKGANSVLERIPGLPEDWRIGQMGAVSVPRFENNAWDSLGDRSGEFADRVSDIASSDPLGEFFDAVKQRAIANALKPTKEELEQIATALEEIRRRGEAMTRSLRTPAEEYADTMRELRELLDANAISMETYGRAAERAEEKLRKLQEQERKRRLDEATDPLSGAIRTLDEYAKQAGSIADTVGGAISRTFQGAEDAIRQFVSKGKIEFGSLVSSILADLAVLSVKQAVLGPIAGALSGVFQGMVGGGGGGNILASVLHDGGMAGVNGGGRMMPAMAFAGAPRLHNGGLIGPGEVPAILKRNERVLNPAESREWDRGRMVQVNISTPDIESFRQSRAQVAADLARAVSFGSRGM